MSIFLIDDDDDDDNDIMLGPLMFIMFINDIIEVRSNNEADIYLFADDAKICRHIVHESNYELLQTALSKLQDWFESWLLKLNIQKCKAVSYGRNVNKDFKYRMLQEGTKMTVQRDDHIKDLLHGSECSRRERKFHLWTFCSLERKCGGTKKQDTVGIFRIEKTPSACG